MLKSLTNGRKTWLIEDSIFFDWWGFLTVDHFTAHILKICKVTEKTKYEEILETKTLSQLCHAIL